MDDRNPATIAAAAGLHAVAAELNRQQQGGAFALSHVPTPARHGRRLRFGLGPGAAPKVFHHDPPKGSKPREKAKNASEFRAVAMREAEVAASFFRIKASYDRFLDPGAVPTVEGARPACGKRSTVLRRSGSSTLAKVEREAASVPIGTAVPLLHTPYTIYDRAPLSLNGFDRVHDLGPPRASARAALGWGGGVGSHGYEARRFPPAPGTLPVAPGRLPAPGRLYLARVPSPRSPTPPLLPSPRRYEKSRSDNVLVNLRNAALRGDLVTLREVLLGAGAPTPPHTPGAPKRRSRASTPRTPKALAAEAAAAADTSASSALAVPRAGDTDPWGAQPLSPLLSEAAAAAAPHEQQQQQQQLSDVEVLTVAALETPHQTSDDASLPHSPSAAQHDARSPHTAHAPHGHHAPGGHFGHGHGRHHGHHGHDHGHHGHDHGASGPGDPERPPTPMSAKPGRRHLARRTLEMDHATPGPSALHTACEHGHADCVDQLLRLGADPSASAEFGLTPLHLATTFGHLAIAENLLRAGGPALLAATTQRGRTACHLAVRADRPDLLGLLLECAAEAGGEEGAEREAEAARQRKEAAKAEAKAERRARRASVGSTGNLPGDKDGGGGGSSGGGGGSSGGGDVPDRRGSNASAGTVESADFSYSGQGSVAAAALGREAGAAEALCYYANTADDQGFRILHEAATRGHAGVVRLLLEAGAETHVRSRGSRRLAGELAVEFGHHAVAKLIHEHAASRGKAPDWPAGFLRSLHDRALPAVTEAKWSFLE